MRQRACALTVTAACLAGCSGSNSSGTSSPSPNTSSLSFFVTSAKSTTGNLGGLRGADAMCQSLGAAAGAGSRTWRAYLSVERDADNGNARTDARSRIGSGPWTNAKGVVVANSLAELHARRGDSTVFVDENGQPINGAASPPPLEHDILTGSAADGTLLAGMTCADWTSNSPALAAQVGHSDGLGPGGDTSGALSSWNSAHANQNCANTAPRGGAGRIYCFARN